jgi:hypothetical protein
MLLATILMVAFSSVLGQGFVSLGERIDDVSQLPRKS